MEKNIDELQMINSHTHVFTKRHLPRILWLWITFLSPFLFLIRTLMSPLLRLIFLARSRPTFFDRAINLQFIGSKNSQNQIFEILRSHYPGKTRFVLLALDMAYMGGGSPVDPYERQLEELANIKAKWPDQAFPFVCVDPNRRDVFQIVKKAIDDYGFQGIKIYPPFGYFPFPFPYRLKSEAQPKGMHHPPKANEVALSEIYSYAETNGIPVLSHCTPGGSHGYRRRYTKHPVTGHKIKKTRKSQAFHLAHPKNYYYLLEQFPKLKLCLAHFGGHLDWNRQMSSPLEPIDSTSISDRGKEAVKNIQQTNEFVDPVWNPSLERVEENTWFNIIRGLLKQKKYQNIFADISYNALSIETMALLKLMVEDNAINEKILFGTDYYVVRVHRSEKEFSIGMRAALGEESFRLIAERNPERFLSWGTRKLA